MVDVTDVPLLDFDRVKTRRSLSQGDEIVAAGTVGTIVHVYHQGEAFEVEFAEPTCAVLTVLRSDLDHA